jgi:hypothetical protein
MKTLLRVLFIFAFLPVACTPKGTSQTAPNIVIENWQNVQIERLCLDIEQSFPEINTSFSLPVEQALRRVFSRMGIKVLPVSGDCDGTLKISLEGNALAEDYMCILGDACGHCFSGSQIQGDLILEYTEQTSYHDSIYGNLNPPGSISECPKTQSGAPYDYSWTRAVLRGLVRIWGAPVLVSAVEDKDPEVQKAAVDLLESQGISSIPILISALKAQKTEVRTRAANALGSFGPQAQSAVPALIDMVGSDDRQSRMAAAGALHLITGEDLGQYQASWQAWLTNPNVEPTLFTTWIDIPIYPGALSPEELGHLLMYKIESGCGDIISYYQSQMPAAGWELLETRDHKFTYKITYQKAEYKAELEFSERTYVEGQPHCDVQIFRLEKK